MKIPKGWKLVPDKATLSMHNAAAFSGLYAPPETHLDDEGRICIMFRCPDWTRVYNVMIDAAPKHPKA